MNFSIRGYAIGPKTSKVEEELGPEVQPKMMTRW